MNYNFRADRKDLTCLSRRKCFSCVRENTERVDTFCGAGVLSHSNLPTHVIRVELRKIQRFGLLEGPEE